MKSPAYKLLLVGLALGIVLAPSGHAQRQLGKKQGPTAKMFLSEVKGDTQIVTGEKIYSGKQATAFDAPGTTVETGDGAHNAFVYSNGTGMYVGENTRIEVDRFVQEPFQPDRNTTETEPSISQSDVFVARGFVGVCTSQMVAGSTMNYGTPHAGVNIRGGKSAIRSAPDETTIYLLDGDLTIRAGNRDLGGATLRPGEQATIRPGLPGQRPSVTIAPIPPETMQGLDESVNVACNARKTVTFETIEKKAQFGAEGDPADVVVAKKEEAKTDAEKQADGKKDEGKKEETKEGSTATANTASFSASDQSTQEIVARPIVPVNPPLNIVVSPARLPGSG